MSQADGNGADRKGENSLELPMLDLPDGHPCHECGRCCAYLAIEIDNPSSLNDYENIHWYLTHRGVSVYVDWEGDWFAEFETVCEHLTEQKTCGIYAERPKICSDFSWDECEVTTRENAWKYRFMTVDELWSWMQAKRPAAWERYQRGREKLIRKREEAGGRLVIRRGRGTDPETRAEA
jgi:Fe-S-cluster containining protein